MIVLLIMFIQKFLKLLDFCIKILILFIEILILTFKILNALLDLEDRFIEDIICLQALVEVLNIIKMILHRSWW